jgi:hypothetical protein
MTTERLIHAKLGDLAGFNDGHGIVIAVFVAVGCGIAVVAWGDVQMPVTPADVLIVPRGELERAAGQYIGHRFDSLKQAQDVLAPFWRGHDHHE